MDSGLKPYLKNILYSICHNTVLKDDEKDHIVIVDEVYEYVAKNAVVFK